MIHIIQQDEGEDSEVEVDEDADEKLPRNWSVLKSTPELQKTKVIHKLDQQSGICQTFAPALSGQPSYYLK